MNIMKELKDDDEENNVELLWSLIEEQLSMFIDHESFFVNWKIYEIIVTNVELNKCQAHVSLKKRLKLKQPLWR